MQRYGAVIGVREEKIAEYKQLHAAAWPAVLQMITDCGMRNYSIFLRQLPDEKHYLFSYFEYAGTDFEGDMAKMAADPATQRWWALMKPMQEPLPGTKPGGWWTEIEEIFHTD